MMNINELIANEKYDEAASQVIMAFLTMLNNSAARFTLTKEELAKITPTIITKLTSGKIDVTKTPTDAPGDDVTPVSSTGVLKITFSGPENDKDFETIPDVVKNIRVGGSYTYTPPSVVGYTASQNLITGKMVAAGVTVAITYTKDVIEEIDEPETATLKITYVGPDDDEDFTAPDAYEDEIEVGEDYSVNSPEVEGYTTETTTVSGTMTSGGKTVTVTYTKKVALEGTGQNPNNTPEPGPEISG